MKKKREKNNSTLPPPPSTSTVPMSPSSAKSIRLVLLKSSVPSTLKRTSIKSLSKEEKPKKKQKNVGKKEETRKTKKKLGTLASTDICNPFPLENVDLKSNTIIKSAPLSHDHSKANIENFDLGGRVEGPCDKTIPKQIFNIILKFSLKCGHTPDLLDFHPKPIRKASTKQLIELENRSQDYDGQH